MPPPLLHAVAGPLLLLAPLMAPAAPSQQSGTGAEAESTLPIESSEQSIDPQSAPPDRRIEQRLVEILDATDAFTNLRVEAEHGVVFLRGEAADAPRKEWASEVARRIEGVVAVVNDLTLEEPPYFDLGPARRSALRAVRDAVRALPMFVAGAALILLGAAASRAFARLLERLLAPRIASEILRASLRRGLTVVVFAFSVYFGLEVAGLTGLAATVVGGTGLIGLALGFAFRDIAENFLSGVLLSVQRPFRIGDTIEVDGYLGVVQRVSSHGTTLLDFDGNAIELSNTTAYKGAVRNYTRNPKTRIELSVGVGYDMPARAAQEIVLAEIRASEVVLDDPEPIALVTDLGDSSVGITVYFWIDGTKHSLLRVRSRMLRRVLEALEAAGAPMPDEAREVVFPHEVPVRIMDGTAAAERGSAAPRGDGSGARDRAPASEAPSPPKPRGPEPDAPSDADPEGGLESETVELQKQADESQLGGDGSGLLETKPPTAPRRP